MQRWMWRAWDRDLVAHEREAAAPAATGVADGLPTDAHSPAMDSISGDDALARERVRARARTGVCRRGMS
jgi:hypothetical protein